VVATLYFGRTILLPIVAAALVTFLLAPTITWLVRRRVPRLAAVLTVVIVLFGMLAFVAGTAAWQLSDLVVRLPSYEQNLKKKFEDLGGSESSILRRVGQSISKVTADLKESTEETEDTAKDTKHRAPEPLPMPVTVVDPVTPLETANLAISSLAGPLASLGVVTVLVIFMSMAREDLRDRVLRLAGVSQLTLTTRTLDELGSRISRYLLLNALINGGFGLTVGLGMFVIGVQYAALWGLLAAVLRFVPYVGVLIAATAPIGLAVAEFPTWSGALAVLALFIVTEVLTANAVEPLIYGRGAGVAPVALLLATLFWGWIWGLAGLALSVPLTVSLAVLGKYLPPLEPLWILLGNEASLSASARYYQRLLAGDVDEASDVIDEYRTDHTLLETFDDVVIPMLAQAERDRSRGDITSAQQELMWNATEQLVDDLADDAAAGGEADVQADRKSPLTVVGVPILDRADELALKMLARVAPSQVKIELLPTVALTAELLSSLAANPPDLVCISALGPGGVGQVYYISKRVRQSFPDLPILVGRWAFQGNFERTSQNIKERGANEVTTRLAASLDILIKLQSQRLPTAAA
jgi:predicted PurR-regulated permease PerM